MECRACIDSLSAYLDGELTDAESRSIQQHLSGCDACRPELESLRYSAQLTEMLPELDVSLGLWDRIESQITPAPQAPVPAGFERGPALWGRFFWPATAVAAAALVLVLIVPPMMAPEYPGEIQSFLEEREARYQQKVRSFEASDFDFHAGTSNPFIRVVSHDGSNPFR